MQHLADAAHTLLTQHKCTNLECIAVTGRWRCITKPFCSQNSTSILTTEAGIIFKNHSGDFSRRLRIQMATLEKRAGNSVALALRPSQRDSYNAYLCNLSR